MQYNPCTVLLVYIIAQQQIILLQVRSGNRVKSSQIAQPMISQSEFKQFWFFPVIKPLQVMLEVCEFQIQLFHRENLMIEQNTLQKMQKLFPSRNIQKTSTRVVKLIFLNRKFRSFLVACRSKANPFLEKTIRLVVFSFWQI